MKTITIFDLEGRPYIALHNLLKVEGLCHSGAAAKIAIEQGLVIVDGCVETRKRCKIIPGMTVRFDGEVIKVA